MFGKKPLSASYKPLDADRYEVTITGPRASQYRAADLAGAQSREIGRTLSYRLLLAQATTMTVEGETFTYTAIYRVR